MAGDKDQYGIPPGGNNGPYAAHSWKKLSWTLTWEETMVAIAQGGWPQEKWGMAGAVCAAESGRNPFVFNTFKKGHFGLFQISRSAHKDFFGADGNSLKWVVPWANSAEGYKIYKSQGWGAWQGKTDGGYLAYYPAAMTAAANLQRKLQLHGGDEKAFLLSLYRKGTQDRILAAMGATGGDFAAIANQAVGDAVGSAAEAAAQGTVDAGAAVAAAVNDNFGWLRDFWVSLTTPALWMRLGYGSLGIVMVAGGLFLIVRNRPAVQKTAAAVKSAAGAVTPVKGAAAVKAAAAPKAAAAVKPAAPKPAPKPAAPKGASK